MRLPPVQEFVGVSVGEHVLTIQIDGCGVEVPYFTE